MTATSGTDALPLSRTAWVTDQIREAILGGEIEPGTLIRHRELEARYGVSATPVREAIQRLAAERLLLATPQRGAGAGLMPASFRICQTVDGATIMPRTASSPWIRRYPHDSFSQASRSTADTVPASSASHARTGHVRPE